MEKRVSQAGEVDCARCKPIGGKYEEGSRKN